MSSEKKFYPQSDYTRNISLNLAVAMNNQAGVNSPLTAKTQTRLNAVNALHQTMVSELRTLKAALSNSIFQKEKERAQTIMFCSHFVQVMNLCINRGEYAPAIRAFYNLPVENEKGYNLKAEDDLKMAGRNLLAGEAERIAQGGVPMSRPSAAEVKVHYDAYLNLSTQASNAKTNLSKARQHIKPVNKEADKVIRKVWAEVETFYNELPNEGMRNHARNWGVVYARKGHPKQITGTVTDAATGLPLAGAKIKLANGRNKTSSNGTGNFKLTTTLMHGQTITATLKGYDTFETTVTLSETENTTCAIQLVRLG